MCCILRRERLPEMKEKQTKSKGYLILHTVLCVLGALILFGCMSMTFLLRHYTKSTALTDSLRAARLSDADVPLSSKTLSEYIRTNFVDDENVLPEDVAQAVDSLKLPEFFADKLEQHFDLLRGRSDTPVQIESSEITALLDNAADQLRESCMLIVSDSDKQMIESETKPVLGFINGLSRLFGSSKAGRALQRLGVSFWGYILESILLLALLWRWIIVRRNAGRDAEGAIRGLGFVKLIPSAILLLLTAIGGIGAVLRDDTVVGLSAVTKIIRIPLWYIAITGVAFALFLIELAAFLRHRRENPKPARAAAKPKKAAAPAAPAVPKVSCVSCGKELDAGMKFCKYCGAKQGPDMKPCISCGAEIEAKTKFCKFCGAKQEIPAAPEIRADEIADAVTETIQSDAAEKDTPAAEQDK